MPNYKTHSIHSDKTYDYIDKRIILDRESIKVYSFGPDTLFFTDPIVFNTQHNKDTKLFFECLIKMIKENKELDNPELISFLYGQINHFILDVTFHPYINYLTTNYKNNILIDQHLQFELWLDSYIMNKYKIFDKKYFKKRSFLNKKTRQIIDLVYQKIYKCFFASNKYDAGISAFITIEQDIRRNKTITSTLNNISIADLEYSDDSNIKPFLNNERQTWQNPINGEENVESLNELWNQSVSDYIECISDINAYLYDDKPLKNRFLTSNLSYDTALPCEVPKKLIYARKY